MGARSAIDCTLFAMNLIFFFGGGIIVALGSVMVSSAEWEEVYGSGIDKYAFSVLAFGLTVVFTSFCGCLGAKKRSRVLLLTYAAVLGIMLIAQIYHLGEHFPDGLLLWALGILPLAWLTASRLLHALHLLILGGHRCMPLRGGHGSGAWFAGLLVVSVEEGEAVALEPPKGGSLPGGEGR